MIINRFILLIFTLFIAGCSSPPPVKEPATPPKPPAAVKTAAPELVVLVGSLNISRLTKAIDREDIRKLSAILKRDSIDILAIQGITRYPELPNRLDVVNSLATSSGMRSSFGETMTLSGRQSGNAVFSNYPIRSTANTPYERLRSTKLEAAFQAVIDCGPKDLVVVSTLIPDNPSLEDQSTVVNLLGTFNSFYADNPVLITGNLPASSTMRDIASYKDAEPIPDRTAPRIWLSQKQSVHLLGIRVENTPFGPVTVARIGMFRQNTR